LQIKSWKDLSSFKGNQLSIEEKWYRLTRLQSFIKIGEDYLPDKEFIPYLEKLNSFWFIMTTQCCSGHYDNPKRNCRAHIDFRSALSIEDTINKIIRPFDNLQNPPVSIGITAEGNRLRFILWIKNEKWEEQIKQLIEICEKVEGEK